MDDMEVMTRGWWRPSPGSVYPLLEEMVEERTVRHREDGAYELSESAVQETGWPWVTSPRTPKEVVNELAGLTSYLEDLSRTDPKSCAAVSPDVSAIARRLQLLSK